MIRLGIILAFVASAAGAGPDVSERPVARSVSEVAAIPIAANPVEVAALSPGVVSLRPSLRPRAIEQRAAARRAERRKGQVCGDPDIQGDVVGFVPGRIKGCGIAEAVRVKSVSGVTLSQPATLDCSAARALKTWTNKSAKKNLSSIGGGLASYRVAAHYACRTRNNQPGARISEHGRGKAIDISGFTLRDGSTLTVLKDWNSRNRALKRMHKDACGTFGTVLGPNSDRFHQDHFHFDTARHRGGAFCR